ncbi:PIH1 domain-containing protein 1 [Rhizophlyctis rosea]|uniref:PIH1 domain-containing protein 1 n=1 Tax=Rhizophlyctis rosea TaxID=64517 RepID=A0AAD5SAI1_9FUNG|nr:PIH1 domain-containing protein 1 [Rhizophlyctis rosea]
MALEDLLSSITSTNNPSASTSSNTTSRTTDFPTDLSDPTLQSLISTLTPPTITEETAPANEITPESGFVVKTHLAKPFEEWPVGLKVFINLCHSAAIPAPPLLSPPELHQAISDPSTSNYKVPLSLTGPRNDRDKAGKICLTFDACINSTPLRQSHTDEDFKMFLIELAVEWIEEKCKVFLSREFSLPRMKSKGPLSKHIIRRAKRPIIAEVDNKLKTKSVAPVPLTKANVKRVDAVPEPKYKITEVKDGGVAKGLVVEIELGDVTDITPATLDIEQSRLIFSLPDRYALDVELKRKVDTQVGNAKFDLGTGKLSVWLGCL